MSLTIAHAAAPRLASSPVRARILLALVHLPFVVGPAVFTIAGREGRPPQPAFVVVALAFAIGGLQLRHSFAARTGRRPRLWPWSYAALACLVIVPLFWFTVTWLTMTAFIVASTLMLLTGRRRIQLAVTTVAVVAGGIAVYDFFSYGIVAAIVVLLYWACGLVFIAGCLYGSALLTASLEELHAAQVELADAAVEAERRRVSRDVHDLLGQTLSAIALKSDLAASLLATDAEGARREAHAVADLAASAVRELSAVTQGGHSTSLSIELRRAAVVLRAAGITPRIESHGVTVEPAVDRALAWAVREGVTNVLRHATATTCSIELRTEGDVTLEIRNDGVSHDATRDVLDLAGSGIAGMRERVAVLAGTVRTETVEDRFVLTVRIPAAPAGERR